LVASEFCDINLLVKNVASKKAEKESKLKRKRWSEYLKKGNGMKNSTHENAKN
jgi:hypothetical protein